MEGKGDASRPHAWRRVMTAVFDLLRDEPGGELN